MLYVLCFSDDHPGDNLQGMAGRPVSWELLFHSLMLYHENLRRDLPSPEAASLYRHPPTRGITQREVDGLTSYLELLTTIITWVRHRGFKKIH